MTTNLGPADRVLRALVGLLLFMAPLANMPSIWASSAAAYAAMGVGLVLIATSFFRFCPVYRVFGISTCKS
ncbi:hypothetical protein GCM10007385_39010 [Tateyamaria omphalii]|uniref:YgaP family membrane protein n=1 Tax=Tateyamaria omphalii TaxID=299262 RepID=UPI0016746529|nr:DUF2892 domain-containing protein [Tateyamaria omphalii]GGX66010.1 hypothetical protein GCM10007385_39010 [Tateyamaria omphalii]